jgi:hypothetical protein
LPDSALLHQYGARLKMGALIGVQEDLRVRYVVKPIRVCARHDQFDDQVG